MVGKGSLHCEQIVAGIFVLRAAYHVVIVGASGAMIPGYNVYC